MNSSATAAILTEHLAPAQHIIISQTVEKAGLIPHLWSENHRAEGLEPPALIIAGLPRGERSLSPVISEMAERLAPNAGVLLMCQEPLITPIVHCATGRLVLISSSCSDDLLVEQITLAKAWQKNQIATNALQEWLIDHVWIGRVGHGREMAVSCGADVRLSQSADPAICQRLLGDTAPILAAWRSQNHAEQTVLPRHPGRWRCAALTHGAVRWSLATTTEADPIWLFSASRMPAHWSFAASEGLAVRVIPAAAGDVLLLGNRLPDDAALAPAHLGRIATGGGHALLSYLQQQSERLAFQLDAVVVEIRP